MWKLTIKFHSEESKKEVSHQRKPLFNGYLNYRGEKGASKLSWGFTFCSFSIKNLSL